LLTLVHWIRIYPVDSIIQPLNNQGQMFILYAKVLYRKEQYQKLSNKPCNTNSNSGEDGACLIKRVLI